MFSIIKRNKFSTILLLLLLFVILKDRIPTPLSLFRQQTGNYATDSQSVYRGGIGAVGEAPASFGMPALEKMTSDVIYPPVPETPPQSGVKDRLVIQNSDVSLLVKDVVDTRNKIVAYAQGNGGYMVNSNTSNPQDAPTGQVTIRIDSSKMQAALDYFHTLSVKVVSENLSGYDVTDEYIDVEKRIAILEVTKAKFNEILTRAGEISDITNLNQQIINIQSQIDSYKGQQDALSANAKLSRITIYLSTDEIALPYAPSETFRPGVIFKLAFRSLVSHLRQAATLVIWAGVYGIVWIPLLLIVYLVYRKFNRVNRSN
ncbi:MAG: DUF4349 domain-containing protein [Patescibacteria group bacterium]